MEEPVIRRQAKLFSKPLEWNFTDYKHFSKPLQVQFIQ